MPSFNSIRALGPAGGGRRVRGKTNLYGLATGGTSSSILVNGVTYTLLTFTGSGTLTILRPGFFDLLVIAAGGGGGGTDGSADQRGWRRRRRW